MFGLSLAIPDSGVDFRLDLVLSSEAILFKGLGFGPGAINKMLGVSELGLVS